MLVIALVVTSVISETTTITGTETGLEKLGGVQPGSASAYPESGSSSVVSTEPTPRYSRGRDFERWAYSNGTMTMVTYMGPRFVRHYATGEFVNLVFEDHRAEGYCLIQNSYIGLKAYDNRTVLYAPDMDEVAVDEAYFVVQVYNGSAWLDLKLGAPSLRVDACNSTAVILTQTYNGLRGRLEISYVVRDGELLKYNIVFTSLTDTSNQFRVVQRFLGIHGANVTYGDVEDAPINGSREFIAPFFAISRDKLVLSVYLQDLGRSSVGGWVSDKLEKIALSVSAEGINAEVVIGNYSLGRNEALMIDPLVTTVPIVGGNDDTYVEHWQKFLWVEGYGYTDCVDEGYNGSLGSHWLTFGYDQDEVYHDYMITRLYKSFLRWPILIPDGCVVQSAYLNMCSAATFTYDLTPWIRVLNFSSCPAFNKDTDEQIFGYGVMSNITSWPITDDWSEGEWVGVYVTQNLKDFMNRGDYALGNYMGLRIESLDTGGEDYYREIYSYDEGASKAPKLQITFTAQKETFTEPLENWSFEDDSAWSADNLLLHMDEGAGNTTYDGGPNDNDGTLCNMASTVWVDGTFGKALSFDGLDDYVEVPDSSSLDITEKLTVEFWMKTMWVPPNSSAIPLTKGCYWGAWWFEYMPSGRLDFFLTLSDYYCVSIPEGLLNDGSWHNITGTYDGSTMRVYLDSVEKDSRSVNGSIGTTNNPLTIGKGGWSGSNWGQRWFNGVIDEVRISDGKTNITVNSTQYMHGKHSWNVTGPSNQDAMVAQLLDKEVTEYVRNRRDNQNRGVCFSFWYKPESALSDRTKNNARAEIYYMNSSGSYTVIGLWVTPNNTNWYMAQVKTSLPTDTQIVKLRITGHYYNNEPFKAWIDQATLSVYYYNTTSDPAHGNVTLVTDIFYSGAMQIPQYDGFVSASLGLMAEAKSPYTVYKFREMKVELLPNNGPGTGSMTTQAGRLIILYFQQKNRKGLEINPLEDQEFVNHVNSASQLALTIGLVVSEAAFTVLVPSMEVAWKAAALSLGWSVGGEALSFLLTVGERIVHCPAATGETSYYIYETVDYWDKLGWGESSRVDLADAQYLFDWRFRTDSDDIFAIKVSATVEWGLWGGSSWCKVAETTVSFVISLANYWQ